VQPAIGLSQYCDRLYLLFDRGNFGGDSWCCDARGSVLRVLIFFGQGAPTVQLNFNLANAVLTGAVSGTSTYRDMLTTNCGGWCEPDFQTAQDSASVNLRAAFASAALAGPGAEFFYALAIICLIVQTISNVNFLCNNACCIPVCNTPIVGLAISVTAFPSQVKAPRNEMQGAHQRFPAHLVKRGLTK
jgi:hypothetical protein